jgi:glucose/arabinose dehydrogenase
VGGALEVNVRRAVICFVLAGLVVASGAVVPAAQQQAAMPPRPLPATPFTIDTAEAGRVRVTPIAGLDHPWSLAFLPNGDMLVTERPGRLRVIRDGAVDPTPVAGVPAVEAGGGGGLMEIALHPRFADTRLVYLSYTKDVGGGRHTPALSRGRLQGHALSDVEEIFVADTPGMGPPAGAAMLFGPDGYLYMTVGGANDDIAQDVSSHQGKIVRLAEDGSPAPGNPFAGRPDVRPEIFSLGHRNMFGMTVHPVTGAIWESENGPLGGDEVNILKAGANYGWPIVTLGRNYDGARVSDLFQREGLEDPELHWTPSIAISGMTFYTGDRFPAWRNNLFVGGLQLGRIPGTGQMHRVVFNERWEEVRREALFTDLRQRIRNVEQGPDGLIYVLTDEDDGAILRLEPVP